MDARYSSSAEETGLERARPPSLAGRANRSLNPSFGGGWPVRAGMSEDLMEDSSG